MGSCPSGGVAKAACILVLVGAINWGLIGLGGFLGFDGNVVAMLLGGFPVVLDAVYVLVGLSAVWKLAKCGSCG